MATEKKSPTVNYTKHTTPPAQLWIGPHELLVDNVKSFLQKLFCSKNGCKTCSTCININAQQHHAALWLYPEKQYTLDILEDIFSSILFQLNQNEARFFIIQKADFLTPLCANKLLKPIEEPPRGYHFILLAQQTESVLPTIRSRCIIHSFNKTNKTTASHPIVDCFTSSLSLLTESISTIDQTTINERESIEALDEIISYWTQQHKKNITDTHDNQTKIQQIIKIVVDANQHPPMPGSSKMFWRNLYLTLSNMRK